VVEYCVRLPVFEGPFALLFHLIEKAEVDICDISVAEITAQYLSYLQELSELNVDVAAEFLVMAATLLKLKSKRLLPGIQVPDNEPEESAPAVSSEEELVQRLLEYRYFQTVARELRRCEQEQKRVFVRSPGGKTVLVNPTGEAAGAAGLSCLLNAFQLLLSRHEAQPEEVYTDELSVRDKMKQVLRKLAGKQDGLDFRELFPERPSVAAIIVTFFALLELIRLGKIRVWQDKPFGLLICKRNVA
jgi:segregation and condensation protein A